jgi:hypothetical protein
LERLAMMAMEGNLRPLAALAVLLNQFSLVFVFTGTLLITAVVLDLVSDALY